jgi:uncharacterized coiled-coil protein SlyX
MMKEEFEKRIGLVITSEEYADIEAAYMGLPESVDKDKFVKIWLREGGIQDLFDRRLLRVRSMTDNVNTLEKRNRANERLIEDLERTVSEYEREIKALREKLMNIGSAVTEALITESPVER